MPLVSNSGVTRHCIWQCGWTTRWSSNLYSVLVQTSQYETRFVDSTSKTVVATKTLHSRLVSQKRNRLLRSKRFAKRSHTHSKTHTHTRTHARTHARTHTRTRTHAHMHARTHACMQTRIHTYTHAHIHTCMYVCMATSYNCCFLSVNQLGQTPLDESSETIRPLMQMFRVSDLPLKEYLTR